MFHTRKPSLTLTLSCALIAWMEVLIFFWCPTSVISSSTSWLRPSLATCSMELMPAAENICYKSLQDWSKLVCYKSPAKLSLYLVIFRLASQSSTELNLVRSGASGASGLAAWNSQHFYPPDNWISDISTWLAAIFLRVSGQQMSLSRVLTMLEKVGLWALSFCQQSSISWWMASGQSMGAGNLGRKMTWDERRLLGEIK